MQVFDVGKDVDVMIHPRNRDSAAPTPDLTLFQAKVLTPEGTVIQAKLELHDNGTISVHFVSFISGRHRLAVQLNGVPLRGSPSSLEVRGEPDYSPGTSLLQKESMEVLKRSPNLNILSDVQTDFAGNFYILLDNVIRVSDSNLNPSNSIHLNHVLKKPWNHAITSEGQIIISDTQSHQLFVFDKDGTFLYGIGKEGEGEGELKTPLGIATDCYDNIAVCDAGNHRIQLFNPDKSFKCSFGNEQNDEIMYPIAVIFNKQGQVVVSESSLWFSNYHPLKPPPFAIDAANSIECVKIFDRDGKILQKFGEPGEERGQFWVPFALLIDHSNNIWVADFTYGCIQIFDEKGKLKEVFPSKEKEKGAGVLSTFGLASNGQVFAFSALL